MTRVPFVKMHGAANDFVVVDHRRPFLPAPADVLFAHLCDRRRGIGADGVLLLEGDDDCDFRMRYFNADGGAADWCGNGARCLVRFALDLGLGRDGEVRFRTDAGLQHGRRAAGGRIAVAVESFASRAQPRRVEAAGRSFEGAFVEAGVPHFVTAVDDLAAVPVDAWGRALRTHAAFGAAGANVDFVAPHGAAVAMRTYERGVEGETLACGSGAIATAAWALGRGAGSPVTVMTAGGDALEVSLDPAGVRYDVVLTGPAEVAFTGTWGGTDAPGKEA